MTSPAFQAKFSKQQREAAVLAYCDRGVRPMTLIPRMAAAGELSLHGVQVPPFEPSYGTVRGWIKTEEKRRRGHVQTDPEDAVEALRGQLLDVARLGIEALEKKQKNGKPDWELMRQAARCLREIKAIPPKSEPRGVQPGQRDPKTGGMDHGGATAGGLAGSVLTAHRRGPAEQDGPVPERLSPQQAHAENGAQATTQSGELGENEAPGSVERRAARPKSRLLQPAG